MSAHVVDTYYYDILGLEPNASSAEIKKSYRRLAMKWHPDKNPSAREEATEQFKLIAEAYSILGDPTKRNHYDMHGREVSSEGPEHEDNYHHAHVDLNFASSLFESFFQHQDRAMSSAFADDFFSGFGNLGFPFRGSIFGNSMNSFSSHDDFFNSFMGSNMFSDTFNMGSSNSCFFSAGCTKSRRQVTTTVGGRTVSKTETIIRHPDGRIETVSEERVSGDQPRELLQSGNRHTKARQNYDSHVRSSSHSNNSHSIADYSSSNYRDDHRAHYNENYHHNTLYDNDNHSSRRRRQAN